MYITGWHWRHFVSKSGVPSLSFPFLSAQILLGVANVRARQSGPYSLRKGSLIFGIVCLVTLLIFPQSSLIVFKRTVKCVDFSDSHSCFAYCYYASTYLFLIILLRAALSAVFQPCRTGYCSSCTFLPRCMECRRGLAMRIPSVRPSVRPPVCLSVRRMNCDKTAERYVYIFIRYER